MPPLDPCPKSMGIGAPEPSGDLLDALVEVLLRPGNAPVRVHAHYALGSAYGRACLRTRTRIHAGARPRVPACAGARTRARSDI